jgi:uncharacterized protein YbcI
LGERKPVRTAREEQEGDDIRMSDGDSVADVAAAARSTHSADLAAISRRVVGLMKEYYGKGPTEARTYHSGDLVVVLLRGLYTQAEKTLIAGGHVDVVSKQRSAFQQTIRPLLRQVVEEEMRRPVAAFMSTNNTEPDMSAEVFVLDESIDGDNGA